MKSNYQFGVIGYASTSPTLTTFIKRQKFGWTNHGGDIVEDTPTTWEEVLDHRLMEYKFWLQGMSKKKR